MPASLANLPLLRSLDLSSNSLASVPGALAGLPATLTSLQLQYNQLGALPNLSDWLAGCLATASVSQPSAPCTFRVDSNRLTAFPTCALDTVLAGPYAVRGAGSAPQLGFVGNLVTSPLPAALLLLDPQPGARFTSVGAGYVTTCAAGTSASSYTTGGGVGTPSFPAPVCAPCAPGSASAVGAACSPCPANTFANTSACAACPLGAASPARSPSATACVCASDGSSPGEGGACPPPRAPPSLQGPVLAPLWGFFALTAAVALLLVRRRAAATAAAHGAALAAAAVDLAAAEAEAEAGWRAVVSDSSELKNYRCLGSGGFGTVYVAQWRGTTVAVKMFKPGAPPGGGARAGARAARAPALAAAPRAAGPVPRAAAQARRRRRCAAAAL